MKKLILVLLLSLVSWAEPRIDCEVRSLDGGQLVLIVEGTDEVKTMQLVTPIDSSAYKQFGARKMILMWPQGLPVYPTLFFLVNGQELHYIPQLKQQDFQTRATEPS